MKSLREIGSQTFTLENEVREVDSAPGSLVGIDGGCLHMYLVEDRPEHWYGWTPKKFDECDMSMKDTFKFIANWASLVCSSHITRGFDPSFAVVRDASAEGWSAIALLEHGSSPFRSVIVVAKEEASKDALWRRLLQGGAEEDMHPDAVYGREYLRRSRSAY